MALDQELFEEFVQHPGSLPILRIYRVTEPSITVGRSWSSSLRAGNPDRGEAISVRGLLRRPAPLRFGGAETPRNDACICVRPTGGGWVHHGNDLIYSVLARRDSFSTFHQVRTSYLSFHEALQEAFRKFGIETRLFRCDEAKRRNGTHWKPPQRMEDCFLLPVATDILFQERKIAGGAQWRRGQAFLHQGSVQLPKGISFEKLKRAIVETFERKFRIDFEKGDLLVKQPKEASAFQR